LVGNNPPSACLRFFSSPFLISIALFPPLSVRNWPIHGIFFFRDKSCLTPHSAGAPGVPLLFEVLAHSPGKLPSCPFFPGAAFDVSSMGLFRLPFFFFAHCWDRCHKGPCPPIGRRCFLLCRQLCSCPLFPQLSWQWRVSLV